MNAKTELNSQEQEAKLNRLDKRLGRPGTMSWYYRVLITEVALGQKELTDQQIHEKVMAKFNLPVESRKTFVSWYRYDCARKGLIEGTAKVDISDFD